MMQSSRKHSVCIKTIRSVIEPMLFRKLAASCAELNSSNKKGANLNTNIFMFPIDQKNVRSCDSYPQHRTSHQLYKCFSVFQLIILITLLNWSVWIHLYSIVSRCRKKNSVKKLQQIPSTQHAQHQMADRNLATR